MQQRTTQDQVQKFISTHTVFTPEGRKKVLQGIKENGSILCQVPLHLRDYELCMAAVKSVSSAIMFVPPEVATPDMALEAVKGNIHSFRLPEVRRLFCKKFFIGAIRAKIIQIQYYLIPQGKTFSEAVDYDICLELVKNFKAWIGPSCNSGRTGSIYDFYIHVLDIIPERLMTQELFDEALKAFPSSLIIIKSDTGHKFRKYLTRDIILFCVEKDNEVISYVPPDLIDDDILNLVKPVYWYLVPKCAYTTKFYARIIASEPELLTSMVYSYRNVEITKDMAVTAANQGVLAKSQKRFYTKELCHKAFSLNPSCFTEIPYSFITQDMIDEALKHDWKYLDRLTLEDKTYDRCLNVVKREGKAIQYVPKKFKDYQMCLAAVKNNPEVYKRAIPKRYRRHKYHLLRWYAGVNTYYIETLSEIRASEIISRWVLRYLYNPRAGKNGPLVIKELKQAIEEW